MNARIDYIATLRSPEDLKLIYLIFPSRVNILLALHDKSTGVLSCLFMCASLFDQWRLMQCLIFYSDFDLALCIKPIRKKLLQH